MKEKEADEKASDILKNITDSCWKAHVETSIIHYAILDALKEAYEKGKKDAKSETTG